MRLRTIDAGYRELREADPGIALTKTALRKMIVSGQIPSTKVGNKFLFDIDMLQKYLFPDADAIPNVEEGETPPDG